MKSKLVLIIALTLIACTIGAWLFGAFHDGGGAR